MSEDWDLFAVVRSCSSSASPARIQAKPSRNEQQQQQQQQNHPLSYLNTQEQQDPPVTNRESFSCNELHDSCKPFLPLIIKQEQGVLKSQDHEKLSGIRAFPSSVSATMTSSSTSSSSSVFVFRCQRDQQQQQQLLQQQSHTPLRSRKRKNQQKRTICHVTQENLSCDMWAWRKYGQKPIKGSPYPRNYYRCSSSKGCLARKQVERSNLDPNIFIVTYTGEHIHPPPTHRNSLAGSTRNKSQPIAKPQPKQELHLSPNTPLNENDDVQGDEEMEEEEIEEEEEEEDDDDMEDLLIPNLTVKDQDRDDLFSNMQGFTGNFPSCSAGSAVD